MLFFFFTISKSKFIAYTVIPYYFTIPSISKKSIFIKILLFNLSLLFLFIRYCLGVIPFSWAFQPVFFSQAPSTSSTNTNTNKHKPTPIKKNHHRSRFETQPRPRPNHDLKPTGANPFKKNHHQSHLSHNPTTTRPRPNHDQRPTSSQLADPRPTTNDPLHPSSPIHDHNPTTPIHNPQPRQKP